MVPVQNSTHPVMRLFCTVTTDLTKTKERDALMFFGYSKKMLPFTASPIASPGRYLNGSQKLTAFCMTLLLIVSLSAGCGSGNANPTDAVASADSFLKAVQNADLDTAAKYASPEVIDRLGWSDDDINDVMNDFFAAIAGYGISEEDLRAIPEVEASIGQFTDKLKTSLITSYDIDKSSVKSENNACTLNASVVKFSEDDFYALLDDELIHEVAEFSINYAQEHGGLTDENVPDGEEAAPVSDVSMYTDLYRALVPFVMEKLSTRLDELAGTDSTTWVMTITPADGKMLITDIEDANGE